MVSITLSLSMGAQGAPGNVQTANEFINALRIAQTTSAARRWPDAARAWEQVVQRNPVNEEYWQRMAEAHYKSGDFQKAISAFEKVLDLGGHCFPS
jgi:DNA-binding SARP family transcriptional activator